MIIAIDGTLASGKGTIARAIAAHYALPHLDTGKLYRATGVAAMQAGADFEDEDALAKIAARLDLDAFEDAELRTSGAGSAASKVAVFPGVRAALLQYQRDFASQPGGTVLDGRDIGTVICPDADVKLWIDARVEVRAARRLAELHARGEMLSLEDMIDQLKARDARDRDRKDAPMIAAEDAVLIDTSDLTIDAAVEYAKRAVTSVLEKKPAASGTDRQS